MEGLVLQACGNPDDIDRDVEEADIHQATPLQPKDAALAMDEEG